MTNIESVLHETRVFPSRVPEAVLTTQPSPLPQAWILNRALVRRGLSAIRVGSGAGLANEKGRATCLFRACWTKQAPFLLSVG